MLYFVVHGAQIPTEREVATYAKSDSENRVYRAIFYKNAEEASP